MRPTFYLDLDRTLFRTERVYEIIAKIAELYPEKPSLVDGYELRHNHYVYPFAAEGDTRTYSHDLSWWLRDHGLDPGSVYGRLLESELTDGRFEYKDVAELVGQLKSRGEVKILTFGVDEYQRFKAALCPSLEGVEVITTLKSKTEYLNRYGRDGDWMVDDKLITGAKKGVELVVINHSRRKKDTGTCYSLAEVQRRIEGVLDEKA